ncbi:Methyltransferase-like protein 2 [Mizuhopecten yessoensis]|uniref:Methyltransferase-like protein 2 n=2 Tax=Mizuhopecten yessoensis TaxID=6573 RepID=A0A210Q7M9_MIZYE|nr:Methyltransferase-like protein 2 [Mizuhopecten yessoensis]
MSALLRNLFRKTRLHLSLRIQIRSKSGSAHIFNNTSVYCKDSSKNRPPYGARPLVDPDNVFHFNNWDNVVWDEEQETDARRVTSQQLKDQLSEEDQVEYDVNAGDYWNKFYNQHNNRFFKDRHWLFTEFPELAPEGALVSPEGSNDSQMSNNSCNKDSLESNNLLEQAPYAAVGGSDIPGGVTKCYSEGQSKDKCDSVSDIPQQEPKVTVDDQNSSNTCDSESSFPGQDAKFRIFEVGCGVGNTVFPVLRTNNDPNLMIYCCDFSSTAIQLVKEHPEYIPRRCHAFVSDITDSSTPLPFPEGSLDLIILIFVLSAVHPDRMQDVVDRLAKHLKPGGTIMFRDYGRYDLAQLRFKKGRCLSENFYVRGDGTRVYFFTQDELKDMFTKAGLKEKQNYVDRRLQVNRGKQLKMYRVWIQCKYTKPDHDLHAGEEVTGDGREIIQDIKRDSNKSDTTETEPASGAEAQSPHLLSESPS